MDSQWFEFVQLVKVIQLQLDDGIVRYVPGGLGRDTREAA